MSAEHPTNSSPPTGAGEPSTATQLQSVGEPSRVHAAKPSVANAASLFGADGDADPFASIAAEPEPVDGADAGAGSTTQASALSTLGEEREPAYSSNMTPTALHVPDSHAHDDALASPSALFAEQTGSAAGVDDWLGGSAAHANADPTGDQQDQSAHGADLADPNAWPSYDDYAGRGAQEYGEQYDAYGAYEGYDAQQAQNGQYSSYDPAQQEAYSAQYGTYDASQQQTYDGQYQAQEPTQSASQSAQQYGAYGASQQQQNSYEVGQHDYGAPQRGQGYADYYGEGYDAAEQSAQNYTQQADSYEAGNGHQNGYDPTYAHANYAGQQSAQGYAADVYGQQYTADPVNQYGVQSDYASSAAYDPNAQQGAYDYSRAHHDAPQNGPEATLQESYQPQHDPYAPSQDVAGAYSNDGQYYHPENAETNNYSYGAQYGDATPAQTDPYDPHNGYSAPYAAGPSEVPIPDVVSSLPSASQAPPKGPPRGPPKGPPRRKVEAEAQPASSTAERIREPAAPYAAGPGSYENTGVEQNPTELDGAAAESGVSGYASPQSWANNLESAVSPPPRANASSRGADPSPIEEQIVPQPPALTFSSYESSGTLEDAQPSQAVEEDTDQTPPANVAPLPSNGPDMEGAEAALRDLDLEGTESAEARQLADENGQDAHRVYSVADPSDEAYGSYAAAAATADKGGSAYDAFGEEPATADGEGQGSLYEQQYQSGGQSQYGYEQPPEPYGQETHVSQYNPYAPRNAGVNGSYQDSNASSSAISEDGGYESYSAFQNGLSVDDQHEEAPYSAGPPSSQYAAFRQEIPQINHPSNAGEDPYADEAPTPRSAYIPAPGREVQDGSQTAPVHSSSHDPSGALSPWAASGAQEARVLTPSSGGTTIQPPTAFKKRIRDLDHSSSSGSSGAYSPSQPPASLPPSTAMSWGGSDLNGSDSPSEKYGSTLGRSGTVTQRSVSSQNLHSAPVGATDSASYFALQQSSAHAGASPGSVGARSSSVYGASSTNLHAQYSSGHQRQPTDSAEERQRARIGIATFGLDGKLVTFLPNAAAEPGTGSGAGTPYGFGAATSRMTIRVSQLSAAVSSHTYGKALDFLRFPGPLFDGTPGAATGGALSRGNSGTTAGAKAKKTALVNYLNEAVAEMERGVGYLKRRRPSFVGSNAEGTPVIEDEDGGADGQRAEDRALLMRLLLVMLEHDGSTLNNPTFDSATRSLLLEGTPHLASGSGSFGSAGLPFGSSHGPNAEQTLQIHKLSSAFLDRVQTLLRAGERREAVALAVEGKMWAHAMVIASSVDRELWKSVVEQFTDSELSARSSAEGLPQATEDVDRHSLRVAYALFSGQESSTIAKSFRISEAHQHGLANSYDTIKAPKGAPRWREAAATILANRGVSGDSAALTAMGDGLLQGGWVEAAHICYLLSPQTAALDGVDGPAVRLTLLGAHSPAASTDYLRDLDHILLTEIYEFIGSLRPVAKGGETYPGLPHLQAFKMLHAHHLAELGDTKGAQKYCDAVASVLKGGKMSRHYHHAFVGQLKELTERVNGGSQDSNGATSGWMTRKISQRPTMDGMWSMLEGRFTKFVAGEDGESTVDAKSNGKGARATRKSDSASGTNTGAVGPFSHYSAITPDNTSGNITRVQSSADFHASNVYGAGAPSGNGSLPPSRAGSAMAFDRGQTQTPLQSSGFETSYPYGAPYSAGGSEWGQPPTASSLSSAYANPSHTPDPYSSDRGSDYGGGPYTSYGATGNAPWPGSTGGYGAGEEEPRSALQPPEEPYYGYQPHGAQQPQFFSNVGGESSNVVESEDGFISTMGSSFGAPVPTASSHAQASAGTARFDEPDDEEDDLGFGNASTAKKAKEREEASKAVQDGDPGKKADKAPERPKDDSKTGGAPAKPEIKPSGSWLGRIWGRKEAPPAADPPGGHKAHLGEESVFYYDKDLKKWVNKKAGSSAPSAAATPPPPRAQTASPSVGGPGAAKPPSRTPSAMSMSAAYSASAGPPSSRSTPPPPISEEGSGSQETPLRSLAAPPPSAFRQRSNLGDPNLPAASQPTMHRSASNASMPGGGAGPPGASATPPPPPGATGTVGRGNKKRPIASRYVKVDP
ncbi:Regucalcin gene promoter region-related protein (RGPR) [Ceraceosorus bombacis]|uniref:Protein transport protein sec16 n=1 Tax=Ceraceosorus bombacis TaxID=401625 RepID=A0A0P1BQD0_9BASI|nr:Regucalcin gene promoter region-related protein (RGPR) [Ceraceosorus bombacis]